MEQHCNALALYFTWYNWVRVHKGLGETPAMAAGPASEPMGMDGIIEPLANGYTTRPG